MNAFVLDGNVDAVEHFGNSEVGDGFSHDEWFDKLSMMAARSPPMKVTCEHRADLNRLGRETMCLRSASRRPWAASRPENRSKENAVRL